MVLLSDIDRNYRGLRDFEVPLFAMVIARVCSFCGQMRTTACPI